MKQVYIDPVWLMHIQKPARYIGGEWNSVVKDHDSVELHVALAFPDVYEVAMSHLGLKIIYSVINKRSDALAERVYAPWVDMEALMKEKQIPLYTLESRCPVRDFDVLGFTLPYEMCYTNVLNMLHLAGIPLRTADRTEEDPLVVAGGPCVYNAEPVADFFDLFFIGEAEESMGEFLETLKMWKREGRPGGRKEFLRRAAHIRGIYVPSLYEVSYEEDGRFRSIRPLADEAALPVYKRIIQDVDHVVIDDKPILPHIEIVHDRAVLEMFRGCSRGCRFCQAGMVYRPTRERDVEKLKELATHMLRNTGHDEISLSSLSSSDYSHLPELVNYLIDSCPEKGVNISLPSLRIDAFSLDVMSKVQDIKKSSLTFAPEAGSQRMRNVINKGLTEEVILDGAGKAFEGGWNKVKLYFMLGLPTETEDDIKGIAHLAEKIAERYYEIPKDQRNGKCQITASSSFFIPKPFTPFQWAPMNTEEDFLKKASIVKAEVRAQLNQKSIRYIYHEADISLLEGFLARGDRKCAEVIEKAYRKGAIFDAWSEYFRKDAWEEAFAETGIDIMFYACRERSTDEILPWDFLDIGVTKKFLIREWERAQKETVTPNCKMQCSGCGAKSFGGGVCYENQN